MRETQPEPTGNKARTCRIRKGLLVVEMGGIEPPSDSQPRGLLRVQSAFLFLGPQHHADKLLMGSVN